GGEMARDPAGPLLEQLLAERGSSLMAAAIALAGSRQDGEDLLQAALERVLRADAPASQPDPTGEVDQRDALVRLLGQLPPRQRAVIVLRYWEQRSETETATLLGCSEGTVKSAAARGLQHLRELSALNDDPAEL